MNAKERDLLLEIWMDEFGSDVLNLACRILKNNQDAQDVFQNTFIKAYLKSNGFNEKEHVRAWLLRVAKNECVSKLRSGWKKRVVLCDIPQKALEEVNTTRDFSKYIEKLSVKYRQTVWLYYWAGYKTDEISKLMNTSPATVRTRLKRAREQLKLIIQRSSENE